MACNIKIKLIEPSDIEWLHEYIDYDMNTGEFTWAQDVSPRALEGEACGCYEGGKLYIQLLGHKYQACKLAYFHLFGFFPSYVGYEDRDSTNLAFYNLEIISKGEMMKRTNEAKSLET